MPSGFGFFVPAVNRITYRMQRECAVSICLLLLALNVACVDAAPTHIPYPFSPSWQYTDLRLIDPIDAEPESDLAAAYYRSLGADVQLRLDWLDQPMLPAADIYIAIDAQPGGSTSLLGITQTRLAWDTLLIISANGTLKALNAELRSRPGIALRVWREITPDSLEIHFNRAALGQGTRLGFQVFVLSPGSTQVADELEPFYSDGLPPPPAPVLFAFWNSYPAYTPALALRRWDGAHSGPLGGRHGLYNLLRTAQANQIPLALLDLKTPASLQALQYTGYLDFVQHMQAQNLLILPEYLPTFAPGGGPLQDWLLARLAEQADAAAQTSGLPPGPFAYSLGGVAPAWSTTRLQFARLEASTPAYTAATDSRPLAGDALPALRSVQLLRWKGQLVLPIPGEITAVPQLSPDGLSLEARRALVTTAIEQQQTSSILILGGDLPASAWGDPQSARAAFRYIAARPWIQPLNARQLLELHAARPDTSPAQALPASPYQPELSAEEQTALLAALQAAPPGPIGAAAWQAYLSLYAPVYPAPQALPRLRREYTGQVWALLHAARWAAAPAEITTCAADPDQDGQPECILANAQLYAQFEQESGALALLITPDRQWIGPSSQAVVGLSDPFTWRSAQGLASDPAVIPAAFADQAGDYQARLEGSRLVFTSTKNQVQKTYALRGDTLELSYHFSAEPTFLALSIPLLIAPPVCPPAAWRVCLAAAGGGQTWRFGPDQNGAALLIQSNAISTGMRSFMDTPAHVFANPEDPNMEFSSGHFLPFPLSVIDLTHTGDFSVIIRAPVQTTVTSSP